MKTVSPARAMFWLTLTLAAFAVACWLAFLTGLKQAENMGF